MVVNKELKNVQLFAPSQGGPEKNDINDAFMKLVYLNSYYLRIPHYALINPEGRIIDAFFIGLLIKKENNIFPKYF